MKRKKTLLALQREESHYEELKEPFLLESHDSEKGNESMIDRSVDVKEKHILQGNTF